MENNINTGERWYVCEKGGHNIQDVEILDVSFETVKVKEFGVVHDFGRRYKISHFEWVERIFRAVDEKEIEDVVKETFNSIQQQWCDPTEGSATHLDTLVAMQSKNGFELTVDEAATVDFWASAEGTLVSCLADFLQKNYRNFGPWSVKLDDYELSSSPCGPNRGFVEIRLK